MTSPKKKKGQQRKAAKSRAMANYGVSSSRELAAKVEAEAKFVEGVGRGRDLQTRGLSVDINDLNQSSAMLEQVPGQIHKRSLPHVLNFLKRCEDETFDQVLSSVGGDLFSPVIWIVVLIRAMEYEPGNSLQIAENIGPLVSCMCNDTERLFFKSNKLWRDGGIRSFVWLIRSLISNSMEDKELLNALLQHDGLLGSIVQWSFWTDHRPDIVEEIGSTTCGIVVKSGKTITRLLVNKIHQGRNGEDLPKNWLEKVGSTPIVSKAYDPTCMISYVEGMVHQMKTNGFDISDLQTFNQLIIGIDCVDKGVITETINLGFNFITDYKCAFSLALALIPMMRQGTGTELKDSLVAFAIRAGLIEIYMCFIDRFGGHDSFADESYVVGITSSLYSIIKHLLKDIHSVSLHQKTAKAIRSKRESIEKELVRLQQNTSITNNTKCRELLDMVSSILNLNGSYCCRCNKQLSKTEVKQCNGCHRMSYCSRACQKEDWLYGHKQACCSSPTMGQFRGRYIPKTTPENERTATKMKELETNLNMVQLKLLVDNSDTILSQARSLNIPLYDCLVKFELRDCPPTVSVYKYTKLYVTPEQIKKFEETRSKENITCTYCTNWFGGDSEDRLVMQGFYPHECLSKHSVQRRSTS